MSEFLMVVPVGWAELADGSAFVVQHTEAQLLDLINTSQFAAIEAMLQDGGHIAPDAAMSGFRMFRDGDTYRIWYQVS